VRDFNVGEFKDLRAAVGFGNDGFHRGIQPLALSL
jgi:hypothetical protein